MDAPLACRVPAESVGTGILVLFGAGSVVAALTLGDGELDHAIARPRLFEEREPPQATAGDIEGRASGRFDGDAERPVPQPTATKE